MIRAITRTIGIIILNPAMWVVILGVVGFGYLYLSGCSQQRFIDKANRLQLVGKSRQDVIAAFGQPEGTHTFTNNNRVTTALSYNPGSGLDLGCRFYLDTNDTVTEFWDGGSD